MKKVLTIAALVGVASLSYGQGTVNFNAGLTAATRIATNSTAGGPSTGLISGAAGSYYFALFVAPTSTGTGFGSNTSLDPTKFGFSLVSSPSGPYGTNSAAGRFTGNPSSTDPLTVNGYATGSTAEFVVVGWSASNGGPSWSTFLNWYNNGSPTTAGGFAGHSSVADQVALGGGLTPAGNIFGANAGQVPGFTLGLQVPEPTTFALAGLGAAALVIFRRRKA